MVTSILTSYHHSGPGSNVPVSRVVLHGTVSPCVRGGAVANARYFQTPSAGGAAHYVVDPGEIVACVPEDVVAAHAPPNTGSIGVELCDPQTGDGSRWEDADHQAMLHLAAELVADIAQRHSLPLVWLSPADLLAGKHGITSHANVSAAWHQTDHSDPGPDFPVDAFIALVSGSPTPAEEEDTVQFTYVRKKGDGAVYVARHGATPVRIDGPFGYADAEALASYQGDTVKHDVGADVTDAKGQTRKVLDLDSPAALQWFGLA